MAENFDTKQEELEEDKQEAEEETVQESEAEAVEEEDSERPETEESEENEDEKESEEEASDEKPKDGDKVKSFFKKKEKKDKKEELIEQLQDRVKRQMAEFENFRKRSDKEKSRMYDMGAASMLEKILPVVDNFERGLDGLKEEESTPFAEGMKMIYKQLMSALDEAGVKEIEAVGKEFDPELHNAVMHIDDEEYGENEIVEVFEKGYTYHDAVVRHSMVKVAN